MEQILYKSEQSIVYKLIEKADLSTVEVINTETGHILTTYNFKNKPLYHSHYLSWKNLHSNNAWGNDVRYLIDAVNNGTKIHSKVYFKTEATAENYINSVSSNVIGHIVYPNELIEPYHYKVLINLRGCLNHYFNLQEIIHICEMNQVILKHKVLNQFFTRSIYELVKNEYAYLYSFSYFLDQRRLLQPEYFLITQLLLGNPLEATISEINRMQKMIKRHIK